MPVFIGIFAFATGVDIVDIGIHRQATYFFITVLTERILQMKKFTAIAVAGLAGVIGVTSVASAEVTVYGRVTAGAIYADDDTATSDGAWNWGATGIDGSNAHVAGTRFGFKGSQDLGNGMEAGFQIERAIREGERRSATQQRQNNVYLSGHWGKLTLGMQNNPYMKARKWDQTYLYGGNWHESYRLEGISYSMNRGPFSLNVMGLAKVENDDATADIGTTAGMLTAGSGETSGNDAVDAWVLHAGYDFGVVALDFAHHADNLDYDINTAATGTAGDNADQVASRATAAALNNGAVDTNASRDRTAIGVNGSVGAVDWYLAYQTAELNAGGGGFEDNDTTSVGGFLGFQMSENDTLYAYYVAHSGDRPRYNAAGAVTLGEDYTETIVGYSRDMGPGIRFIAEYQSLDLDLDGSDNGSDPSKLALVVRYVF